MVELRRAMRLVTVRFINRLVFVLVGPPPSSLLEDDDDENEKRKKKESRRPFVPS